MKLLKKIAVLSLCVLAVSGCTKSTVTTQDLLEEMQKSGQLQGSEEYVEKEALVEEDAEPETRFDWNQVAEEVEELFHDVSFYPESVLMDYRVSEEEMSIDLGWMLKNGTSEEVAMEYAVEMVQMFNDILAVQVTDIEFSSADSFGGIWDEYSLNLKVGTEDGTWLIEKQYKAGETIDLVLPDYSGEGPAAAATEESDRLSPASSVKETEPIYPGKK